MFLDCRRFACVMLAFVFESWICWSDVRTDEHRLRFRIRSHRALNKPIVNLDAVSCMEKSNHRTLQDLPLCVLESFSHSRSAVYMRICFPINFWICWLVNFMSEGLAWNAVWICIRFWIVFERKARFMFHRRDVILPSLTYISME